MLPRTVPHPRPREQLLGKKRASSSASDDALFCFDEQMGCARQLTPGFSQGNPQIARACQHLRGASISGEPEGRRPAGDGLSRARGPGRV